jgi:EmrB/QacA subfamily drug resistance transporter
MAASSPQSRGKWWALAAAGTGSFTTTLDGNIVKIALPTFTRVFDISPNAAVWVALVNYLTLAGLMLTFAMIADRVGRKKVYILGFAVLTVGLALSPLAQTMPQLLAFRVLQSLGAAMISSIGVAILTVAFPPEERGKALGIMSITTGLGITLGPLAGGFLIDLFGWQAIFLARVPLAIAGLALSWMGIRTAPPPSIRRGLDISGSALFLLAVIALVLGINQGQPRGWTSPPILSLFSLAAILFAVLYFTERRKLHPVADFALFKNRVFAGALITLFFRNLSQMLVLVITPFYLVQARLFSSSLSGVFLMLVPLGLLSFGPLCGWLSDKLSPRRISSAGVFVMFLGFVLLTRLDLNSSTWLIALGLIVCGVGLGIFEAPNIGMIMGAHPREKMNAASAMSSTVRQLSHATGVAMAGAIFTSRQLFHGSILAGQALDPGMLKRLSVVGGFRDAMLLTAALGLVAVFTSFIGGKR